MSDAGQYGAIGAIYRPDDLCISEDSQLGVMMGCPMNSCDIQDEIFPPVGRVFFRGCPPSDESAGIDGAAPTVSGTARRGPAADGLDG